MRSPRTRHAISTRIQGTYYHVCGVTIDGVGLVIGFTAHLCNWLLHFTNHYHTQTNVLSRYLVEASNGGRSPSSGFTN
jgi:hypothetical protein